MRLGIADVERFEHLRYAAVQAGPVGGGNFLVERVSRQRVAEPQATDCAGKLLHDTCSDRLVQHPEQLVDPGVVRDLLQRNELQLPPEDGCERQHAPTLAGQMP